MIIYNYFLKKLEGSFEEFIQSDEVNTYLQTIGGEVKTEILQDGIPSEFIIVSGYEKERGNWATAYNNQIRFGNEVISVQDLTTSMILTPNFFYGKNRRGEDVEYRMGLIKDEKTIIVLPILVRKIGAQIQFKALDDLCVIHRGIVIDPKTAELIGQAKVAKITAYQQFLTCFWNIDDYIRKQNPNFYSDFDVDVWKAVEVFSGRIVDQMLGQITKMVSRTPDWLIPQAESMYQQGLIDWIETSIVEESFISENQILVLVKNLCSYMCRFRNYQPLEDLTKRNINLLPFILRNFRSPNSEIIKESIRTFEMAFEKIPQLIHTIIPIIFDLFDDENQQIRHITLQSFNSALENSPSFFDQDAADKLFDLLLHSEVGSKQTILKACKLIINFLPQFINHSRINQILDQFSDQDSIIRRIAIEAYKLAIEKTSHLITKDGIDQLFTHFSDQDQTVKVSALKAYQAAYENTNGLIDEIKFNKVLVKFLDIMIYSNREVIETLLTVLKKTPKLIDQTHVDKIVLLFSHPDKDIKQKALNAYIEVIARGPQFLDQNGTNEIFDRFSDLNKYVRRAALDLCRNILERTTYQIGQKGINAILDRFSDLDKHVRRKALFLYKLILKKSPHLVVKMESEKVRTLIQDIENDVDIRVYYM